MRLDVPISIIIKIKRYVAASRSIAFCNKLHLTIKYGAVKSFAVVRGGLRRRRAHSLASTAALKRESIKTWDPVTATHWHTLPSLCNIESVWRLYNRQVTVIWPATTMWMLCQRRKFLFCRQDPCHKTTKLKLNTSRFYCPTFVRVFKWKGGQWSGATPAAAWEIPRDSHPRY